MAETKQVFNVTGMTCSACSAFVEKSVKNLEGVKDVQVNLLNNNMKVVFDFPATAEKIIQAVEKGGYGASILGNKKQEAGQKREASNVKLRLILSVCFLVPLMYIAMGHMAGLPGTNFFHTNEYLPAFVLTQFLLTIPVIFINFNFFKKGFTALAHKAPNMDTLVATGSMAAFVYGVYAMYAICISCSRGDFYIAKNLSSNLYFESSAMILTLITVGKYLEQRAKEHTSDAVKALIKLSPQNATVIREGKEMVISASSIVKGDVVAVKAGEKIPCDGIVLSGNGSCDESAITGESIPVYKEKDGKVTGATTLLSGYLTYRAQAVGEDTLFSKIIKLVQDASGSKAPVARLADKVCGVFVPIVMSISLITFIVWMVLANEVGQALKYAISVLVISCPCALGLATPTAIMAGMGRGAQKGILFKNAVALETLHNVKTIVTDKTGTLTKGQPQVTDILTQPETQENELLLLAASLEQKSEHPLAAAIMKKAEGAVLLQVEDFTQIKGLGIKGKINGEAVIIGSGELLREEKIQFQEDTLMALEGKTVLYVAKEGKYLGLIGISDTFREGGMTAWSQLRKRGIELIMLTGDNKVTANAVAKKAGIEKVIAQVKPDEKEQVIRELMTKGKPVAMIGDGINDAPALARADVGIAIGKGSDIAIDSADVVLMHGNFADSIKAIDLSKAVIKNIKENLFWAFFYNILAIPLSAGMLSGLGISLNPMVASLAMSLSSLFVVSNALRLRFFGKEKKGEKKMTKVIKIEGMMCSHCTGRVEKLLNEIQGVTATVSLEDGGKAVVTCMEDMTNNQLKNVIEGAGYKVISIN